MAAASVLRVRSDHRRAPPGVLRSVRPIDTRRIVPRPEPAFSRGEDQEIAPSCTASTRITMASATATCTGGSPSATAMTRPKASTVSAALSARNTMRPMPSPMEMLTPGARNFHRDHFGHDPEERQRDDVDLGVAEEPEQVLPGSRHRSPGRTRAHRGAGPPPTPAGRRSGPGRRSGSGSR